MIELSVTAYIQKFSLPDNNLFPPTSNIFYLNLAQLPKTWLNSPVGLPPTSYFSAPYSFARSLAQLSLLLTLVAFEFRLIGVSATVFKDFWSQNYNEFLNFLRSAIAFKVYWSQNLYFFDSQCNFRLCYMVIMTHEPCLAGNLINQVFHVNFQLIYF